MLWYAFPCPSGCSSVFSVPLWLFENSKIYYLCQDVLLFSELKRSFTIPYPNFGRRYSSTTPLLLDPRGRLRILSPNRDRTFSMGSACIGRDRRRR
jgi:hypothetical protein